MFSWLFKKKKKPNPISVILQGNKLLVKLLDVWPKLNPGRLWLEDVNYIMPTRKELEAILFASKVDSYEYVPEIEDCGDFALLLHADVIRKRYKDYKAGKIHEDQQFPLAFGQIWYQDPIMGSHAINICITCDDGILLIEPQQDKIRKPDKNMTISFIRI